MTDATLAFDHVHLVSPDPRAAANWYVDKLNAVVTKDLQVLGAPQIYLSLGGFIIIIRGRRPAEDASDKPNLQWGVDHFGMRVQGNFDGLCDRLRSKGVTFSMEPVDFNPTTRIAFINAPDGVHIELLNRKDMA